MNTVSKSMSKLLRHGAKPTDMDPRGFLSVKTLQSLVKVSVEQIIEIVEKDDKQRFQLADSKYKVLNLFEDQVGIEDVRCGFIRACQGHSIARVMDPKLGAMVNLDIEYITLPLDTIFIYHFTLLKNVESILRTGISKMRRIHIHFSNNSASATNLRNVCMHVDVESCRSIGIQFRLSANGVILSAGNSEGVIPARFITKIVGP